MNRQENKSAGRTKLLELVRSFDAIEYGHGNVRDDDIGIQLRNRFEQSLSSVRPSNDLECRFEDLRHSLKNTRMVVRQ